jgi:son of sevenless-like protein
MPKTCKEIKLLDIEPLEFARQLTITDSKLFRHIRPRDCLNRVRDVKPEDMDYNISAVIDSSNKAGLYYRNPGLS